MSDETAEQTPARVLRDMIQRQFRGSVLPKAVNDVLRAVDTWVIDVERRVDLLASGQLRLYYNIEPTGAHLDTLATMGDASRMVGLCKRPVLDSPQPYSRVTGDV